MREASGAKFSPGVNGDGEGASASGAVPPRVLHAEAHQSAHPRGSALAADGNSPAPFLGLLMPFLSKCWFPETSCGSRQLSQLSCSTSQHAAPPAVLARQAASQAACCLHPEGNIFLFYFLFFFNSSVCICGFVGLPSSIQLRLGYGCQHQSLPERSPLQKRLWCESLPRPVSPQEKISGCS